jgi:hypothetical protein
MVWLRLGRGLDESVDVGPTASLAERGLVDLRWSRLVTGGVGGVGLVLGLLFVFRVGGWPVAGIAEALVVAAWVAGPASVGLVGVLRPT